MPKKNRNVTKDEEQVLAAVQAMFRRNGGESFCSFREVSKALKLPVPAVAALIRTGWDDGVFSVQVTAPQERMEVTRLEEPLRTRYGLRKVILVPGSPDIVEDLDRNTRRSRQTEAIRAMVPLVAQYLDSLVKKADARMRLEAQSGRTLTPFRIGVPWGRTVHAIAEFLLSTSRAVRSSNVEVNPVIGPTWSSNSRRLEANVVAMDFAQAYGGSSYQLPCPAFLEHSQAQTVESIPQVRDMLEKIRLCDVVVTSMGPIQNQNGGADMSLSNDRTMNAELYEAALATGAVGEICYWLFDEDGNEKVTKWRSMGLGYAGLREIAKKGEVILVSGGDRRRFVGIRAALRGGLVTTLVTETITAKFLMDE
jgi:DNA-binding transcriptional regulator LsrR (DeoR family)